MPDYNLNPKIERAPLPEISRQEGSDFATEAIGANEHLENNNVSLPEVAGHFYNQPIAATVPNEIKALESIMQEGLDEMYMRMLPADQQKFKLKGEETVNAIAMILSQPKVKVKKVLELIKNWLKMIPGVNRFFLEQTAKIKTDRIMNMVKDKKII